MQIKPYLTYRNPLPALAVALPFLAFACGGGGDNTADNRAPTAVNDSATTDQGTEVTIDVLANDTDPESDELTLSSAEDGFFGTTSVQGTQIVYTPQPDFFGLDALSYIIEDGRGNTASGIVFVFVGQRNALPLALDDIAYASQSVAVSIDVLANDTDADDDPLEIVSVTDAQNGSVAIDGSRINYTPIAGFTGDDTFSYTISDGAAGEATGTVSVSIRAVDTDGDGISNYDEESTYGTDPLGEDSDGDGVTDGVEIAAGSDPLDAGSVPPGALLRDDFDSGIFSPFRWLPPTGDATIDLMNTRGSHSVNLGGGGGTLETLPLNSAACPGAALRWSYWVKRGPDAPETGDTLRFQYQNSSGVWLDADLLDGDGSTDPAFVQRTGSIADPEAFHGAASFRFVSAGSGVGFDDFYVDDVTVECYSDGDGDGVSDVLETFIGTNPALADSDSDGFNDGEELNVLGTDPLDSSDPRNEGELNNTPENCEPLATATAVVGALGGNTDFYCVDATAGGDLILDIEAAELNSPMDSYLRVFAADQTTPLASSHNDCDPGGFCDDSYISYNIAETGTYIVDVGSCCVDSGDYSDWYVLRIRFDSDRDGLSDDEEIEKYGSNPYLADSDGDGLSDGLEVLSAGSNPVAADSDGDGLSDGDEVLIYNTDPRAVDSDGDGLSDDLELLILDTNPRSDDTDSDGLTDGEELDVYNTDPTNADGDEDGLTDGDEIFVYGTMPDNPDSDADGLLDGEEINIYGSNPALADGDFDGLLDGDEVFIHGTDPGDSDTDGDNLNDGEEINNHGTDPLNIDTDGDGFDDGLEVSYSTDPTNPGDIPLPPLMYVDNFESGEFSPGMWQSTTGDLAIQTDHVATGLMAAAFGGGGSTATMVPRDTSVCSTINWQFQGQRGPEAPDPGDFLNLEYFNNIGIWVVADSWIGNGGDDGAFSLRSGSIATPDAMHAGFQLRFDGFGTGPGFDVFYMDSLLVECIP